MAKEKEKKEVNKVQVSVYKDEFEAVQDKLDIKEVTARNVREGLGLTQTHSKTGVTSKLIAKIRNLSDEDKVKMYEDLPEEKD